jgi:hypothetical protein
MSFVPMTPGASTSKRSRELAGEIVRTVEEYREKEPRMRDSEVERALMLAKSRLGGTGKTLGLIILGMVLLIGALGFLLTTNFGQ